MAKQVILKKENSLIKGYVGFSWTTLFFGFLVPLIRGDIKWFIVMFLIASLTCGIAWLILPFVYNKIYTRNLLEKGYRPADKNSEILLNVYGLYV